MCIIQSQPLGLPSYFVISKNSEWPTNICRRNNNQRTNGPVNAHLRSAVYTNVIENSQSIGADEALGPFFFFRIINILSIQVFPFK